MGNNVGYDNGDDYDGDDNDGDYDCREDAWWWYYDKIGDDNDDHDCHDNDGHDGHAEW